MNTANIPAVDLVKDRICLGLAMFALEIFAYPLNKVIFEYSLDELVEKVRGNQFINICTGKVFSKGLIK